MFRLRNCMMDDILSLKHLDIIPHKVMSESRCRDTHRDFLFIVNLFLAVAVVVCSYPDYIHWHR